MGYCVFTVMGRIGLLFKKKIMLIFDNKIWGKEKEQDENHLALNPSNSEQSTNDNKFISYRNIFVKRGTHQSPLTALMCSISAPRAGFEPATDPSLVDCSIQLSYRGDLIYDKESIIIDNLSNSIRKVNKKLGTP